MDHVAEIKSRLPIEELVGQYVALKKMGRNFKGLCPFHSERTPSFYVSTDKQLAYCFGCRKGGDHFKFIQEIEHIDFPEALKLLAEKARVELPHISPQQREILKQEKSIKETVTEMHQQAQSFFEEALWGAAGASALNYIRSRGLTDELIKHFHLGYAPAHGGADELYRSLLKAGYSKDDCEKSGLVLTKSTDSSQHFDRFRNRLMIPITNPQGRVCAFGGRALTKEDEPKYLNSPETPIYHKSAVLFGFNEAKNEIRAKDSVVFVEGYFDVIRAYQAGVTNVVATSGTALTKEHLELVKKQTNKLVFSFDADQAGRQATLRALELALPLGFSISIAYWEGEAKDPDELCSQNPQEYVNAVEKPQPVSVFLINYFKGLYGVDTLEHRVACAQALMPYIARIESPLLIDEWFKEAAQHFSVSVDALYKELQTFRRAAGTHAKVTPVAAAKPVSAVLPEKLSLREEFLVGIVLTFPAVVGVINQIIRPEIFLDLELQSVYRTILDQYNQCSDGTFRFDDALSERAVTAQLYAEKLLNESGRDLNQDEAAHEVVSVGLQLARSYVSRQKTHYLSEIRKAANKEQQEELLEYYQQLLAYEHSLSTQS